MTTGPRPPEDTKHRSYHWLKSHQGLEVWWWFSSRWMHGDMSQGFTPKELGEIGYSYLAPALPPSDRAATVSEMTERRGISCPHGTIGYCPKCWMEATRNCPHGRQPDFCPECVAARIASTPPQPDAGYRRGVEDARRVVKVAREDMQSRIGAANQSSIAAALQYFEQEIFKRLDVLLAPPSLSSTGEE